MIQVNDRRQTGALETCAWPTFEKLAGSILEEHNQCGC